MILSNDFDRAGLRALHSHLFHKTHLGPDVHAVKPIVEHTVFVKVDLMSIGRLQKSSGNSRITRPWGGTS